MIGLYSSNKVSVSGSKNVVYYLVMPWHLLVSDEIGHTEGVHAVGATGLIKVITVNIFTCVYL